jgi:hypothetical protein
MNSTFHLLRQWLDTLDRASSEVLLDQRLHGEKVWRKNEATFLNQMRMQNAAAEGLRLLRAARELTADEPSPETLKALADCEALIRRYLKRFEPVSAPPSHTVH